MDEETRRYLDEMMRKINAQFERIHAELRNTRMRQELLQKTLWRRVSSDELSIAVTALIGRIGESEALTQSVHDKLLSLLAGKPDGESAHWTGE